MKIYLYIILFLAFVSCKNDDQAIRIAENLKDAKKKEVIFSNINKSWNFNTTPSNQTSQTLATNWTEWRIFLDEMSKKPKSTIGAFQQKAKNLSKKSLALKNNIPLQFSGPAVRARITVLITKVNSLDLYINLSQIPDAKVVTLIGEINTEIESLQAQMDEITRRSQIQKEEGESADFIKMMDTTRAIPNIVVPTVTPATINQ